MNLNFMNLLLDKCAFPEDAKVYFNELANKVIADGYEAEFDAIIDKYLEVNCDTDIMDDVVEEFAKKHGGNYYSYWMLLLIIASERAKPLYDKRGVTEEVFWDTFSDLRCKAIECMEEHGVWGTFVAFWYGLFFTCRIIKFGRLEYQDNHYDWDRELKYGDLTIEKGRRMLSIHIPSSGEPFDYEARMKSYKMAYDFYSKEFGQDSIVCRCGSWLLYPGYKDVFPENSNTRDFMDDFDIQIIEHEDGFGDAWRLFGKDHRKSLEEYPEDTTMRRNFKKYFLDGGSAGEGIGILVFDGEKIVTRQEK